MNCTDMTIFDLRKETITDVNEMLKADGEITIITNDVNRIPLALIQRSSVVLFDDRSDLGLLAVKDRFDKIGERVLIPRGGSMNCTDIGGIVLAIIVIMLFIPITYVFLLDFKTPYNS